LVAPRRPWRRLRGRAAPALTDKIRAHPGSFGRQPAVRPAAQLPTSRCSVLPFAHVPLALGGYIPLLGLTNQIPSPYPTCVMPDEVSNLFDSTLHENRSQAARLLSLFRRRRCRACGPRRARIGSTGAQRAYTSPIRAPLGSQCASSGHARAWLRQSVVATAAMLVGLLRSCSCSWWLFASGCANGRPHK